MTLINGQIVSKDGIIQMVDTSALAAMAHQTAVSLVNRQRRM